MVASDGPRGAFWWRAHATNAGPIDPPGIPPTGKLVDKWEGADFREYRDGKVARLWIVFDRPTSSGRWGSYPDG